MKVTLQALMAKIKETTYTVLPNGRTTVCQLTLQNGFTVEGQSACVDPANYDKAMGETYAKEDALNNCWKFEGYLLAERMHLGSWLHAQGACFDSPHDWPQGLVLRRRWQPRAGCNGH